MALTKVDHQGAAMMFNRNLEEVSSKFKIYQGYELNEKLNEQGDVEKYVFSLVTPEISGQIREQFSNNEGILYLVDENLKIEINKKFSLEYPPLIDRISEGSMIEKSPDFIYEVQGIYIWVVLHPIRTTDEEENHSHYLKMLYQSLLHANEIDIDADFSQYGITTNEKYHNLVYFRLERNSLFLIIEDKESGKKISHEFKNIREIKCSDLSDRLKFWLYMQKGNYRFYLTRPDKLIDEKLLDPGVLKYY